MKKIVVTFLTAAIIFSMALTASAALDAEAIGMGENFSTLNGEAAYYSNPAGLALRENNFAVKANFGFSVWNNVFENDEFSEDKIEGKLSGDDLIIAGRAAGGTQFYYKNFALAVNARGDGMMTADSDIAEIVTSDRPEIGLDALLDVEGNTITAEFGETKGGAAATADVSLSYAREIFKSWSEKSKKVEGLYFGATYHYLEGEIYEFDGGGEITADYDKTNKEIRYKGRADFYTNETKDGEATGNAFDFGLTLKTAGDYSFAFSAMNIGELSADQYIIKGNEYFADKNNTNKWTNSLTEVKTANDGKLVKEEITYDLPRVYRLGMKKEFSRNTVVYADYSRVSYDLGEDENIYAVGSEFRKTKLIPLRLGVNYSSLREDIEVAAGIGINISNNFKINLGIADLLALSDKAKGVKFGISTLLSF